MWTLIFLIGALIFALHLKSEAEKKVVYGGFEEQPLNDEYRPKTTTEVQTTSTAMTKEQAEALAIQVAQEQTPSYTSSQMFDIAKATNSYTVISTANLTAYKEAQSTGTSTSTGWKQEAEGQIRDPLGNFHSFGYKELPDGTKVYPYYVDAEGRLVANPAYFGGG